MNPILILAAGAASRMRGGDKLLEDVDGQPLLAALCERALATGHTVYVALPDLDHPRADVVPNEAVIVAADGAIEGMGGTMRTALRYLPPCDAFMLLLADLPDITTADMNKIWQARADNPDFLIWRGATTDAKPGHPIIFDASLRPEFAKLRGDTGGESLVHPLRDKTHLTLFDTDRARLDLDTPEDWAAWRAGR